MTEMPQREKQVWCQARRLEIDQYLGFTNIFVFGHCIGQNGQSASVGTDKTLYSRLNNVRKKALHQVNTAILHQR